VKLCSNAVNEAMQQIASRLVESLGNLQQSRPVSPNRLSISNTSYSTPIGTDSTPSIHSERSASQMLLVCKVIAQA